MNAPRPLAPDADAPTRFPRAPFTLQHPYVQEARLALPAIVDLATRLPPDKVEYNLGDLDVHQDPSATPGNGLTIAQTLERIESCRSWMVLKNIERAPAYQALLAESLAGVDDLVRPVFPSVFGVEGFVFVSSAGSVTPFHLDPEHNFLCQIRGTKTVHVWDPDDQLVLPRPRLEASCLGAHRNLDYAPSFQARARSFTLRPGDALYIPVWAPHWVENGPEVSISYSFTFRSDQSERRRKLNFVNGLLRRAGLEPRPEGAAPGRDRLKVAAYQGLVAPMTAAKRSRRLRALWLKRVGRSA